MYATTAKNVKNTSQNMSVHAIFFINLNGRSVGEGQGAIQSAHSMFWSMGCIFCLNKKFKI